METCLTRSSGLMASIAATTVLDVLLVLWATAPGAQAQPRDRAGAGAAQVDVVHECHTTIRFVTGSTPNVDSLPLDRPIPAGTDVEVSVETFDSYPTRASTVAQPNEQVSVLGRVTDDVPDGVVDGRSSLTFTHTTTGELTTVDVTHLGTHPGLDSLTATVCVDWLAPLGPTASPTTTPPQARPVPTIGLPNPNAPTTAGVTTTEPPVHASVADSAVPVPTSAVAVPGPGGTTTTTSPPVPVASSAVAVRAQPAYAG